MTSENVFQTSLHPDDFEKISQILYEYSGIRLTSGKEELVRSRLMKRLRTLSIDSFHNYLRYIKEDAPSQELHVMIDSLTTNKHPSFGKNSISIT
jgi:chemotaxis protein methyltransferase CheR